MITTWLLAAARALYLLAPLLVAAALSAFVLRFNWLARLARPIDGGLSWRGHRLFGDSKTWRGVATAVAGSIVAVGLQRYVFARHVGTLALIDYRHANPLLLGLAFGLGATFGELPNSFVKRQLGIAPGATARGGLALLFYLWDQLDLLAGTWPLLTFWMRPTVLLVLASVVVTLALHPLVALIGYLVGARKTAR